jgi:hypothetical protein
MYGEVELVPKLPYPADSNDGDPRAHWLSGQITVQSCTPGSGNAEVGDAVFNPNDRKVTTRPPARRPVDGADA